jgi:hypothetical protein
MVDARVSSRIDRVYPSLIDGSLHGACLGAESDVPVRPLTVFPGAFDPLHLGHQRIAEIAAELMGVETSWEISVFNVDKPPLSRDELVSRVAQFARLERVWLTRAATFIEKARLFPGAVFVVGADTIQRVMDPRYYGDSCGVRDHVLQELHSSGCRFLVFGRIVSGRFRVLSDLALPAPLGSICQEIPAGKFRLDVSSTALRKARQ